MASLRRPALLIVGQVTIDDVVPALPGAWTRQLGGSCLYALAGARLWLDPAEIGVVARLGDDFPFPLTELLQTIGLEHLALRTIPQSHLIEWLIYEPDGSRRSLPRNPELLAYGGEGEIGMAGIPPKLLDLSPSIEDIPADWRSADAVHLCPQGGTRHVDTLAVLSGSAGWIGVDPSPFYSRSLDAQALATRLAGATAVLPSERELAPALAALPPDQAVRALHAAGFAEVVYKRAALPVWLATGGHCIALPTQATAVVDSTGAGDAFGGAYAANRLLGHPPAEAARRATLTAARVVGCRGVEAALALQRVGAG